MTQERARPQKKYPTTGVFARLTTYQEREEFWSLLVEEETEFFKRFRALTQRLSQ